MPEQQVIHIVYRHNCLASIACVVQEKGNNNGQWWANQLLLALGGPRSWCQTGLRQLSGMLVLVFARTELEVSCSI